VNRTLRTLDALAAASEVLAHDLTPDNSYAVATFLRRENPRVSKKFIGEVIAAMYRERFNDGLDALFEKLELRITSSIHYQDVSDDFLDEIAEDVREIEVGLASGLAGSDWHEKTTRQSALMLIMQVAWRKAKAEFTASLESEEEACAPG
jgi:hypothetical protein